MPTISVVDVPEYDIEEIKKRIDLRAIVTPGSPIRGDRPTKTLCLWHQESTPSLLVYQDHLHCFGQCREHMDVVDFVAWQKGLDVRSDFDRLVSILVDEYVEMSPVVREKRPKKRVKAIPSEVARYYHGRLRDRRQFFYDRGLTDQTIDLAQLGYDRHAFSIPVWSRSGDLVTLRFRRDDLALGDEAPTLPKYWGMEGRNDALLYNLQAMDLVDVWGFVVICEGELDALRLYQEGLPAISAINGVNGLDDELVNQVREFDPPKVIVAYDQDDAGRINGIRVAQSFGMRGKVATWPKEWGKDATDVLQGREVEEFVECLLNAQEPSHLDRYWRMTLRNGVWR